MFEIQISAGATEKLPRWEKPHAKTVARSYNMEGHAQKCVERYCELANKKTEQLYKVSSPCSDDHHLKKEEFESVGGLSKVSSQSVLKCLYLARLGRPDTLRSVNKLARPVTKWTGACDRRLARLISHIHHTNDYQQYYHVGNTAQGCRVGPVQDPDLFGDLEDSKSTSGGILCIFESRTFILVSWMCEKRTSVSHSSTESEIISLDAGLRMDVLLALYLWDVVIEVLRSSNSTESPTNPAAGNCSRNHTSKTKQKGNRDVDQLSHVGYVTTNANSSQGESQLYIFEDNEAVIKMMIKGRSPTMRHVSRTHRVALDWLFDRINWDPKIQIKYVDTRNQLADMLTKGSLTRDEWNHLL